MGNKMNHILVRLWRSLAVKWLFTLLFTGLFGVGLVWFFANRTTNSGFDQLKIDQSQADFATAVTAYYQAHGSFNGVEAVLMPGDSKPNNGQHGSIPPQFILADATNTTILCPPPYHIGVLLTPEQLTQGTPIMANSQRVGTVVFAQGSPALNPFEQRYLDQTNQGLLVGAIGAAVSALLIGVVLTRHFMRPLNDLTAALLAMQQGNLEQVVPVRSQDELGKLTQAFNQMSKDLAQANYLRKQMTADISHDLRTPLTVIGGYLEALQDGTLRPTPQRFETMNAEVLRLKRLVEDLRTLTLADAGELKLACQPVQIEILLNHVAASFQPLFDENKLRLEIQIEPGLPDLTLDRGRMEQALGNLVSNSMRHTPTGGTVILRACKDRETICISVQDTGEGIPGDKLPYIFERLYRVNESRSQQDGESGLGLAIVKSIVEAHGSKVSAQSEFGKGTTITIQMPKKLAISDKVA
jgi:signal transduction histidine kinase